MTLVKAQYNIQPFLPKCISSLKDIIKIAYETPILMLDKEKELMHRYLYETDIEAGHILVLSHLKLVISIAYEIAWHTFIIPDLIQEGIIGLMKATNNFNPALSTRLSSFASYYIKSEMYNFILNNWSIVKIAKTTDQRKLFFNLNRLKNELFQIQNVNKSIADQLKIKLYTVEQMQNRLEQRDMSIDMEIENTSTEDVESNPEFIVSSEDWSKKVGRQIATSLDCLDIRSKDIIHLRYFQDKPCTLKDLSLKYNVSLERIRQIEKHALSLLRKSIQRYSGEADET